MLKEILVLFVPGAVGVLFYRYLEKTKWGIWSYIENYSLFTFTIYFLGRTTFYLGGLQEFSIRTVGLSAQFKFGVLGLIYAVVIACVAHFRRSIWTMIVTLLTKAAAKF